MVKAEIGFMQVLCIFGDCIRIVMGMHFPTSQKQRTQHHALQVRLLNIHIVPLRLYYNYK